MIGKRIRAAREELGLTQSQVAGKEVSRVLISLIERGECKPSLHTLGLLAQRLGKPMEYFLMEETLPEEAAQSVIRRAFRSLDERQIELALGHAQAALRVAAQTGNPAIEIEARRALGLALQAAGRVEEAVSMLEAGLTICLRRSEPEIAARFYLALGNCALVLEELPQARRHYTRACELAEGKKRLQETWAQAMIYLGTVRYRTGALPEAIQAFEAVVDQCDKAAWPNQWGEAALGLGALLLRAGKTTEASKRLKQAETHFRSRKDPRLHQTRHNLALVEAAEGRWEHAYAILQQSADGFRSLGMHRDLASTLEEIGTYWVRKGEPARARESLNEALELLGETDNGILRGRIYRLLGHVAQQSGNRAQAESYLLISVELLRRLKASEEQALSESALQIVKSSSY